MLTVKVRTALKAKQICTKVQKMKEEIYPLRRKRRIKERFTYDRILCAIKLLESNQDIIQTGVTKYDAIMIL